MFLELVRVQTPDGCTLDGVVQKPAASTSIPLDGVILVHGTGSNFYQSTLLEQVAETIVSSGVAAVRINTRGHDGISIAATAKGGLRAGAAFECVDDCRRDLLGWVRFARSRLGPRIALLGHSLGAVKCVYAAAHEAELDPAAIFAVSPPRLSFSAFSRSTQREEFLKTFETASQLVREGRGEALIESTVPLPMTISAGGFVDKYGPDERINFLPLVERLSCLSLFVFGAIEVESNVAFQGLPAEIDALRLGTCRREVSVIAGADHFYSGKRRELCDLIAAELRRTASPFRESSIG